MDPEIWKGKRNGLSEAQLKPLYMKKNMFDIEADALIYRVFPIDRLLEVFRIGKLTLTKPASWGDPFENFLFQAPVIGPEGDVSSLEKLRERYYGQCWTMKEESNWMWRIYAPDKDGAKVRTTAKNLFNYFYDINNPSHYLSFFIGKVDYYQESEIRVAFVQEGVGLYWITDTSNRRGVQTLLIKRKEFDYEEEVRLVFVAQEYGNAGKAAATWDITNPLCQFPVTPNELFEEIVLDPRMPKWHYQHYRDELRRLGYAKKIEQSSLYEPPRIVIIEG